MCMDGFIKSATQFLVKHIFREIARFIVIDIIVIIQALMVNGLA